ncbi:MAG TPA: hypothetical protein VN240_06910, partial [Propylenella sp.]|nr:hypothetical protein [Propylenella sp.]
VSTYVLRDIAAMANQFGTQTQALSAATANLADTGETVQAGLVERREALEAIAAGLSQQAEAVESRLTRLTSLLSETLGTAEQRITSLAGTVREQTETTTSQATGAMTQTLAATQEQMATFSAELFRLGESLSRVTEQSTRSASGRISDALRAAEERIAEVAESISRITEETATASSGTLTTVLGDAEKRVAALSQELGRRAEEAARGAIGQFETMRLAAIAEGKRAVEGVEAARLDMQKKLQEATSGSSESVRAAAGTLVQEIAGAVADATKRFAATADEMRRAAHDMQAELAKTREELTKGIVELPVEAREATASVRQAITEQIEAINELSKIVARYAGESTLVQPPSGPAAPVEVAAKAATQPRPVARTDEVRPAKPAAAQTALAEPFGRPAGATLGGNGAPKAAAPLPPPAPLDKSGKGGNGEARGWVADLLRRASSDEDDAPPPRGEPAAPAEPPASGKRSPAQVVESLNSLSIDIARAIDHEASVELWDRYKRGERNVFTRRLYTLQGQKTFDELRRKYEHDGDFRQAVDNYIGDFERLLSQVSKDDADPAMARMYLTSDTGKVYTMLAHAAGRLS